MGKRMYMCIRILAAGLHAETNSRSVRLGNQSMWICICWRLGDGEGFITTEVRGASLRASRPKGELGRLVICRFRSAHADSSDID